MFKQQSVEKNNKIVDANNKSFTSNNKLLVSTKNKSRCKLVEENWGKWTLMHCKNVFL